MWHTDIVEILGFITGALCVWLLVRENIWNWPIGMANNAFFVVVFMRSGLYGDAGLQIVYMTLAAYGWWLWLRPPGTSPELPVRKTTGQEWIWLAAITALAAVLLRYFLTAYTPSTVPGWDGLTTAMSLAATWGQCRKLLESWWVWIAVDLIYIPLYAYKGLNLTALLNFIFLLMCIAGLLSWQKARKKAMLKRAPEAAAQPA